MPLRIPVGLRYMAYGAFWFSVMSLLVKVAGARLTSAEIVLVRAVLTLTLSWALVHRAGLAPFGHAPRRLLVTRGLLGFLALSCFYFSLVHLPLAEATVIQYANPIFAAVLAAWLLGEHFGTRELLGVGAGVIGVLLLARPAALFGHGAALNPLYIAIALGGAACSAGAYVTVRMIRHANDALVIVFYLGLVSVPAAIPLAIPGWRWPTPTEWLVLLGIGVSTQVGQIYLTRGLQLEPAGRATAVGYLQIVFATGWGITLFREHPDLLTVLGAIIIVAGTLGIALRRAP